MSVFRMSLAAGLLAAGTTHAAVLDFTDSIYSFDFDTAVFVGPLGTLVETQITEEAGGVEFTITPRFQDGEPAPWISSEGLTFGPQGNPLTGLSIVPNQDVVLTSLEGILLNPQFDFSFGPVLEVPLPPGAPSFGAPVLRDFPNFSDTLSEVTIFDGSYTLSAGSELFIDYFTDRAGDGRITRLLFDGGTGGVDPIDPVDPGLTPVPLPASGLLLLFGLGGMAALRRARPGQSARTET